MSAWDLASLLADIVTINADISCEVNAITLDSREINQGALFVALKGGQRHGLEFTEQVVKKGASAIIWESDNNFSQPNVSIPCIEVKNLRDHLGVIANRFYGEPSKSLDVIGVTGTDGKTTVTHFIAQAFNTDARDAAVIGTLGTGVPGKMKETGHTTPDVLSVHRVLADMKQRKLAHVAMEVSSHALDQGRVNGVKFDVVALTNLTRDHLDYHQTVEAYANAKAKLFDWPSAKVLVLNLLDDFGMELAKKHASRAKAGEIKIIGYCENVGEGAVGEYADECLVATNPKFTTQGIQADILFESEIVHLDAPVLGAFNLHNLLAAMGSLVGLGMRLKEAAERLGKVKTVPGRMEMIPNDQGILVVVDYAHTPGALESALNALRKHTPKRLICVFGCGGDRDRGKRPLMARVAEKNADMVVLTDDNPRSEMPFQIMHDMIEGLETPEHVAMEHSRERAIKFAVNSAAPGDAILIAGKGHETIQIVAGETLEFDDRKQAAIALQEVAA